MVMVGWVDTEDPSLGVEWADAPTDVDVLSRYLSAAHGQCVEFLPHQRVIVRDPDTGEVTSDTLKPIIPDPVPAGFVMAQLLQAAALWRAQTAGSGNQVGPEGLAVTVFPMDWTVKNLLRPRRVGRVL